MGVELGKVLAKAILAQLEKPSDVKNHDSSVRIYLAAVLRIISLIDSCFQTTGLIHYYQKYRKE